MESLIEKVCIEEFEEEDPVPHLRAAKTQDLAPVAKEPQADEDDLPY